MQNLPSHACWSTDLEFNVGGLGRGRRNYPLGCLLEEEFAGEEDEQDLNSVDDGAEEGSAGGAGGGLRRAMASRCAGCDSARVSGCVFG